MAEEGDLALHLADVLTLAQDYQPVMPLVLSGMLTGEKCILAGDLFAGVVAVLGPDVSCERLYALREVLAQHGHQRAEFRCYQRGPQGDWRIVKLDDHAPV